MSNNTHVLCGSDPGWQKRRVESEVLEVATKSTKNWHPRNLGELRTEIASRIRWLKKLRKIIEKQEDKILQTVGEEKGRDPFKVYITEYLPTLALIRDYERNAYRILKPENRSRLFSFSWANKKRWVVKIPYGVVGVISPSNHPFSLPLGAIISAITAGNAVIWKPAPETPKTSNLVKDIVFKSMFQAGLVPALEVIPSGVEYGEALVRCHLINKIHFTGSVQAGFEVNKANAETRLVPPVLELGGSNAAIVLEDADIEEAARVIVWARNVVMSCNNIKRVFAVREVFEELAMEVEILTTFCESHELGESFSDQEVGHYHEFIRNAKSTNAQFVRINQFPGIDFPNRVPPTVIKIRDPYAASISMRVLYDETFTPILPIVKVMDEKEAVQLAEHTSFGLGASVFTKDKARAERIAMKLSVGSASHNDAMTEFAIPGIPFGGWLHSGTGYTHGPEGLLELVRKKVILLERAKAPKLQLFPWTKGKMKWLKRWGKLIVRFSR